MTETILKCYEVKTLSELEIGDIFIHAADLSKRPKEFLVIGKPLFNIRHGRPTRKCIELSSEQTIGKSCPMFVKKTRESKHKQALQAKYA